jgi:hypothetical protein
MVSRNRVSAGHRDWTQRQTGQHAGGVGFQALSRAEQQDLHHLADRVQTPGRHQAIAAIVAPAADYGDAVRSGPVLAREISHRAAGVLHQRQRINSMLLACGPVDVGHFRCGGDLHFFAPAFSSSSRKRDGSPITIR